MLLTDNTNQTYSDFLASKITVAESVGFAANPAELHPSTKPHQADAILWALQTGRGL